MADILKYGWVRGGRLGVEMKVGGDAYFHRLGGALVTASGTGSGLTVVKPITASTDVVLGWAEVPRADVPGTNSYWKSSSTSGVDKVYVITDPTAEFSMPVFENAASFTASMVGQFVGASAEGSTTTTKQKCLNKVCVASPRKQLKIVGANEDERCYYVRLNLQV